MNPGLLKLELAHYGATLDPSLARQGGLGTPIDAPEAADTDRAVDLVLPGVILARTRLRNERSRGRFTVCAKDDRVFVVMGQDDAEMQRIDVRVLPLGISSNHATNRSRLMATAVATCCKCVLASPR